jgi:hypothetical protein
LRTKPGCDAGSCGAPCGTFAGGLPVPGQKLVQLVAPGLPGHEGDPSLIVFRIHGRPVTAGARGGVIENQVTLRHAFEGRLTDFPRRKMTA